MALEIS